MKTNWCIAVTSLMILFCACVSAPPKNENPSSYFSPDFSLERLQASSIGVLLPKIRLKETRTQFPSIEIRSDFSVPLMNMAMKRMKDAGLRVFNPEYDSSEAGPNRTIGLDRVQRLKPYMKNLSMGSLLPDNYDITYQQVRDGLMSNEERLSLFKDFFNTDYVLILTGEVRYLMTTEKGDLEHPLAHDLLAAVNVEYSSEMACYSLATGKLVFWLVMTNPLPLDLVDSKKASMDPRSKIDGISDYAIDYLTEKIQLFPLLAGYGVDPITEDGEGVLNYLSTFYFLEQWDGLQAALNSILR
jgi:hypothetical protein